MASFFIPLTGLEADSTALNTIANDLANMNTTAFKAQTTNFADLFYQQIGSTGSGDPIQVGAGVQVAANETQFSQGTVNSTGNATDIALNGNGFFVVGNGTGAYEYTRAGDFTQDENGYLVTASGLNVMGYPAVNGVVNSNAPLIPINIPVGQVQEPQASSTFGMTTNLNSSSAAGTQFPGQISLYDSLGAAHIATVTYTETAPNTWNYSIALPASDFTGGVSTPVTGTMAFNSNGTLTTVTPTGGAAETVGTAAGDVSSIAVGFNGLAGGASNLNMQWNLLGPGGTPTITQVDTGSAVSATTQNGYPSGQYSSFAIGSNGTVTVTYSNGQQQNVGQLAMANVENLQGLRLLGNDNYAVTLASGSASVGTSGTAGLGTVSDGALEASNVNISDEFSQLIIAQRAFEANAKSVTTFDTVTQDTINMVH